MKIVIELDMPYYDSERSICDDSNEVFASVVHEANAAAASLAYELPMLAIVEKVQVQR